MLTAFFDRLPAYAVVDESVNLARELVRKNARGMVNAVLRKLADAIDHHDPKTPWSPAGNRLPVDNGTLFLKDNLLPDPAEKLENICPWSPAIPRLWSNAGWKFMTATP
ncbi:MAG: hypothetical protein HC898_09740 [Phycisphaerales bacterium]|nr:hypothetical protein [Phycisphaerales bacterium]